MSIKVEDYYPRETFNKMKAFADQHETPFVVIDTAIISHCLLYTSPSPRDS